MEWLLIGLLMWSSPVLGGIETVQMVEVPTAIPGRFTTEDECRRSGRAIASAVLRVSNEKYEVQKELERRMTQARGQTYISPNHNRDAYVNSLMPVCVEVGKGPSG